MICVLLVAGVEVPLERDLAEDERLRGIPRALLPVGGVPMLDYWWASLLSTREVTSVYLVCSAANYIHYARWAAAKGLPQSKVINTGATSLGNSHGAANDLHLALRRAARDLGSEAVREACVIAGDSLFFKDFDLPQVLGCWRRLHKPDAAAHRRAGEAATGGAGAGVSLVLYYRLGDNEEPAKRGVVVVDPASKRLLNFVEKPSKDSLPPLPPGQHRLACPLFYVLDTEAISLLADYCTANRGKRVSCGSFIEWSVHKTAYVGLRLPGAFSLIGLSAGLSEYRALSEHFSSPGASQGAYEQDQPAHGSQQQRRQQQQQQQQQQQLAAASPPGSPIAKARSAPPPMPMPAAAPLAAVAGLGPAISLPKRAYGQAYARVGFLGNPSDAYFGRVMSATIKNFRAQVWLVEQPRLSLRPHPLFDPTEFDGLGDLHSIVVQEGYNGGMRLALCCLKKFFELCQQHQIALPRRSFEFSYDTNIPRQVGLSGSSAIVTALFRALMSFYGLTDNEIAKPLQPAFVLSVETELGITAGLQDRVVQCYEGLVDMDFAKEVMTRQGHGTYTKLPLSLLPAGRFFIAYRNDPSESGKIHSTVRQRYNDGDKAVHEAMARLASFATQGRVCCEAGDWAGFANLMRQNFAVRREIFGDAVIGASNLEMVSIAERHGAAAKFPGSGGAILVLVQPGADVAALRCDYEDHGCVFTALEFVG